MEIKNQSNDEIKQKIYHYYIDFEEDKFSKVKVFKSKIKLEWTGDSLKDTFMKTEKLIYHNLTINIEYREKDKYGSFFFIFNYSNTDDGYPPRMENLNLYLILDGTKNLFFDDISGNNRSSDTFKQADNSYYNAYLETAQLSVNVSDFLEIAKAENIEYSIRFGGGKMDGTFSLNAVNIFKGIYNAVFDDNFELNRLSKFIDEKNGIEKKEVKRKNIVSIIFLIIIMLFLGYLYKSCF